MEWKFDADYECRGVPLSTKWQHAKELSSIILGMRFRRDYHSSIRLTYAWINHAPLIVSILGGNPASWLLPGSNEALLAPCQSMTIDWLLKNGNSPPVTYFCASHENEWMVLVSAFSGHWTYKVSFRHHEITDSTCSAYRWYLVHHVQQILFIISINTTSISMTEMCWLNYGWKQQTPLWSLIPGHHKLPDTFG